MRITLQAAISHWSEAVVHSHPFLEISPENLGVSRYFYHVTKADRNFRAHFPEKPF